MGSKFDNAIRVGGRSLLAVVITILPFVIHVAPSNGTFFDSTFTFVAVFVLAGLAAGIACGFYAVPASLVACFLALKWLEHTGFIGRGGDGDLFYLLALLGTAASFVATIVGAALRPKVFKAAGR